MDHQRAPYASLTTEALAELAQDDFQDHKSPKKAFYRHHELYDVSTQATNGGCNLCQLIFECFIHNPCDEAEQP